MNLADSIVRKRVFWQEIPRNCSGLLNGLKLLHSKLQNRNFRLIEEFLHAGLHFNITHPICKILDDLMTDCFPK